MASVCRKPNSPYWMMKYRAEDGRVVMRSTKQTHHKKALALANETERMAHKARQGELTQAVILKNLGEMMERTTGEKLAVASIKDFFKEYMEIKKRVGAAPSTLARYSPIMNGFVGSLTAARQKGSIATVTPSEIERFRNAELEIGKSESTCDLELKVISSVLASAHRKGLALTNPALAVEPLRGDSEERAPFTDKQVKALLNKADSEWTGMILFGYHCGIRLNDAANLCWENLSLKESTVTFLEQKTARRKRKKDKGTTIVLHPDIIGWLRSQPTGIGKAPVFLSLVGRKSGSAGGLSNMFSDLMVEAKIASGLGEKLKGKGRRFRKYGFHSFRHTMISNLANAEVSADVRMAMSGHSTEDIHQRYVHLNLEGQRKAVGRMASVLSE